MTAPNSYWYRENEETAEFSHVEFDYQDVGPILADLDALGAS